jgi:hypothetical protein
MELQLNRNTLASPIKEKVMAQMHSHCKSVSPVPCMLPVFLLVLTLFLVPAAGLAQNLGYEGPTGVFVTPLASVAASPANGVGKPVVADHVLAGGPVIGTFNTVSVTEGLFKRVEVGYTREDHAKGDTAGLSPLWTGSMNIVHGKINLIPENAGKNPAVPAVSVGGIGRFTDENVGDGVNGQTKTNGDVYVVATKVVTQITKKVPWLFSAGARGTNAELWGLGGNTKDFSARAFGAIAWVFTCPNKTTVILGSEIAQQPRHLLVTSAKGVESSAFDIPTSEVYAIRIVPSPKLKLNLDAGVLQAAGTIAPGVNLKVRARMGFGISYGF